MQNLGGKQSVLWELENREFFSNLTNTPRRENKG